MTIRKQKGLISLKFCKLVNEFFDKLLQKMNWKLILKLSMFGLAMAFSTIYLIPSNIESVFWLFIFIACAYIIAKSCTGRYFLNGFMVSILNCIWITTVHLLFFDIYIENHPEEIQLMSEIGIESYSTVTMLITGIVIGILSGLVLGLFSFVASKLVKKELSE